MSAARQQFLFETDTAPPAAPDGFRYQAEFITRAEEAALCAWLATLPFEPFHFRGYDALRRVVSFGWRYDSSRTQLEKTSSVPDGLAALHARVEAFAGVAPGEMQQVLINEYRPGAPIGWHRDRPIFDKVAGVSLGSACPFRFRRRIGDGFERITSTVAPRSVYLLDGPARTDWEHSIPPVEAHRYSITFRSFRKDGPSR